MNDRTVLLLRETIVESVIEDMVSFAAAVATIGVGVVLNSTAMQWCGFLLFCGFLMGRLGARRPVTPQEAADQLYAEFDVVAGKEAGK